MIKGIVIKNFRIFETFKLLLNDDLNLLVGDNEAGKSTILEATHHLICQHLTVAPV